MTTFERLSYQKAKLLGMDNHKLSLRIARQKAVITTLMTTMKTMNITRDALVKEIHRNEAIIAGQQAQIAKLQGVKA